MLPRHKLILVRLLHTFVWALLATFVLAIPLFAWRGNYAIAGVLIALILLEVLVLAINGMRCPLTNIAASFTDDRRANFDIYLPEWLARHNQRIFGTLFVLGLVYALVRWITQPG